MRVGPGSYDSHIVFNSLNKEPCPASLHTNQFGNQGTGNYIMVG